MQKYILKSLPWIIIIFLLSALVVTQCSKQTMKFSDFEQEYKDVIYNDKARVVALQKRAEKLLDELHKDSVRRANELHKLRTENANLRKRIVPVRKEVEKIADTVAIVKQYLGLTDSLDVIQDSTIAFLSMEKVQMWNNFNELLTVADQKFKASNEIVTQYEALNKELEKRYKRERLKKNGWKIIAGILGTALVAQSLDVF